MELNTEIKTTKKMVETYIESKVFILSLDEYEAQTLYMLCAKIRGLSKRREVLNNIYKFLSPNLEVRYINNEFTGSLDCHTGDKNR